MEILLVIFLTALATEATVKVLMSGKIFDGIRNAIYDLIKEDTFIGKLIRCPYCLSFWWALVLFILWMFATPLWMIYCAIMSIQRLSNVIDDITDKIFYGQYGSAGLVFKDENESSDTETYNETDK